MKTLFISLLAKAEMSKTGLFLRDPKAEEIVANVDFDFTKLKQSKWLSMFLSLRAKLLDDKWLEEIKPTRNVLVVAEGLTMYLSEAEIKQLLTNLKQKFGSVYLIFDAYSGRGVRLSKVKNPISQVGAKVQFGIDQPADFLKLNDDLEFVAAYPIQQQDNSLKGWTKLVFNHLYYCGKIAQSILSEWKLPKIWNHSAVSRHF